MRCNRPLCFRIAGGFRIDSVAQCHVRPGAACAQPQPLWCFGALVLWVKRELGRRSDAAPRNAPAHSKQLLTYLRLMDQPLGLLMNFGADMFRNGLKRVINNRSDYIAPAET
jgi:PD-(D/E)XK nuclease superfamily